MPLCAKRLTQFALLVICLALTFGAAHVGPRVALSQAESAAFAEAINQANLRAGPGLNFAQVGTIFSGTRYPLVGRSARFPWYLIALPGGQGWVYKDLVRVTGDLGAVPFTEAVLDASSPTPSAGATAGVRSSASRTPSLTPSPTPQGVVAEAISETIVRYGPGIRFARVGTIRKGDFYPVLRRHTQYPWLEIGYPGVASGRGWVFQDTVHVVGNVFSLPATSAETMDYPTLTPTLPMVVTSAPPWSDAPAPQPDAASRVASLGDRIYNFLLQQKFEPGTERLGAAFLMDLRTGQAYSMMPNVAFSGVSMMKIPVMVAFYRKANQTPTREDARKVAGMMVCSENVDSNATLRVIGDEDEIQGALYVTETMRKLGLRHTFLARSFLVPLPNETPTPENVIKTVKTDADQVSTNPNPYNQTTPADLGWLLGSIYQCALDGSGPLATTFPGDFTVNECRQMIRVMRENDATDALIRSGLPADIALAHKHGWDEETHGDAAIVFTPGGDYVLVAMLHDKDWLSPDVSFPLVGEISRMVYNAYNPSRPLNKVRDWDVPQCTIRVSLINDLVAPNLPPIR